MDICKVVVGANYFFKFSKYQKKKSKNIQSNHTFKIFQTIDVALNLTWHNYIKGLEDSITQTSLHKTSNLQK